MAITDIPAYLYTPGSGKYRLAELLLTGTDDFKILKDQTHLADKTISNVKYEVKRVVDEFLELRV